MTIKHDQTGKNPPPAQQPQAWQPTWKPSEANTPAKLSAAE